MTLTLLLLLSPGAPAAPTSPAGPDQDTIIRGSRAVVAAVVAEARRNRRRARPVRGDDLTALYVRAGAGAARGLADAEAVPALLVGLGVALDRATLMRYNPLVGLTWRRVESASERKARLEVLGEPTVHGRHDLAQHFFVSAALAALLGDRAADAAGVAKELLDAQEGGSGFSFADLAADLAGVRFARRLLDKPARVARLEKHFRVTDFALPPKGLEEGMSMKAFENRFGGVGDERFKKRRAEILRRLAALPGFQKGNEQGQ